MRSSIAASEARSSALVAPRSVIRVDATSFTRIKGQALMRSLEVIGQSETDFAFRDPFNVVWDLNLAGNPVFASPYQ